MVKCLNPCFSGTYSQSKEDEYYCLEKTLYVLILVLVEHTLRVMDTLSTITRDVS